MATMQFRAKCVPWRNLLFACTVHLSVSQVEALVESEEHLKSREAALRSNEAALKGALAQVCRLAVPMQVA
jgi:hypothetical protein